MQFFFVVITLPFSLIAMLMAFLITRNEHQQHKLKRRRLFRKSFRAAVAFFVFALTPIPQEK